MQIQGQFNVSPQPSTAIGYMQTVGTETLQLLPMQSGRKQENAFSVYSADLTIHTIEIQYIFSKAACSQIPLLDGALSNAVQTSHRWELERRNGETTTDCLTIGFPENPIEDALITLWGGQAMALQLLGLLKLQHTW